MGFVNLNKLFDSSLIAQSGTISSRRATFSYDLCPQIAHVETLAVVNK